MLKSAEVDNVMCACICLMINILLAIICYSRYKSIFSPPVILNVMWGLSNFMNCILGWNSNEIEYLILVFPPAMFSIGFLVSTYNLRKFERVELKLTSFCFKEKYLDFLFAINCVFSGLYFAFIIKNIPTYYSGSLWYTLRRITWFEETESIAIFKYPIIPIFIMPTLFIYQFRMTGKGLVRALFSFVFALMWGFFSSSRTPIFTFIILTLFAQLMFYIGNKSIKERKKMNKVIVLAGCFILFMFIYVAIKKNGDLYGDVSTFSFVIKSLVNYTNLSSACFVEWIKGGYVSTGGRNTFRIVFAVLDRLGMDVIVPNTSSGGVFLEYEGFTSNAFTVARNYVQDFGVIFMACMLFLFGCVHGFFYKRALTTRSVKKFSYTIFCAAFYVPVFFQIMTDQYVNNMSMWIQYFFWSMVLVLPRFLCSKGARDTGHV